MDVGGRATQDAKAEPRRRSNLLLPKPQIAASLGLLLMNFPPLSLRGAPATK